MRDQEHRHSDREAREQAGAGFEHGAEWLESDGRADHGDGGGGRHDRQPQPHPAAIDSGVEWRNPVGHQSGELDRFVRIGRGLHHFGGLGGLSGQLDADQSVVVVGPCVDQTAQRPETPQVARHLLRRQSKVLAEQAVANPSNPLADPGIGARVNGDIALGIDPHRTPREIRRADARQDVVDDHHLRVHERRDLADP